MKPGMVTTSTGRKMPRADFDKLPRAKGAIVLKSGGDGKRREFAMQISEVSPDRVGDVILGKAWEKARDEFMKSPAVAIGHELDAAFALNIGRVTDYRVDGKSVIAEGYLGRTAHAEAVWMNLEDEIPQMASVAFYPKVQRDATDEDRAQFGAEAKTIIEEIEILHFGIVNVGMHPATFTRRKGLELRGEMADKAKQMFAECLDHLNAAATIMNTMQEMIAGLDGDGSPDHDAEPEPGHGGAEPTEDDVRRLLNGLDLSGAVKTSRAESPRHEPKEG